MVVMMSVAHLSMGKLNAHLGDSSRDLAWQLAPSATRVSEDKAELKILLVILYGEERPEQERFREQMSIRRQFCHLLWFSSFVYSPSSARGGKNTREKGCLQLTG